LVYDVRLQPLDERWLDDVAELVADPQVRRFTRIPEPPPQDFARSWIDKYSEGHRDGTCEGFAVVDGDGRFVGLALAPAIDRRIRELELGYIVASGARGRGIATEILRLLTDWALCVPST
jgi:RimJ/RimL family protein N-acetyltransferase